MLVKKIEIKLNKTQQNQFVIDQNNLRFMHNFYLSYQDLNHEMYRLGNSDIKFISGYEFMKLFNNEILKLNPDLNFIKNTNSKAVLHVIRNLDQTFKKFFKNQSGYPKYKKKSNTWKIGIHLMHSDTKYEWKMSERKVKLPSYGWVKLKEKDYLTKDDHIRSCVLKQEGNRFYCCFLIDSENQIKEPIKSDLRKVEINSNKDSLGIDLGIKTYATCSDGQTYCFPKQKVNRLNKKVKKVQKKLSRQFLKNKNKKEWMKKNVDKTKLKLRVLFDKKQRLVLGFIQHLVNNLVKTKHQNLIIEDLKVSNMVKNKHLAKSIQERSFHTFKQKLINKCSKVGKTLFLANTFYPSSKTCSNCGSLKKDLKLSDRVYRCEVCGNVIDRDYNASINLSYIGGYAENLSLVYKSS